MESLVRPLPVATTKQYGRWLLRKLRRYSVAGDSMVPTLQPDQIVLAEAVTDPETLALGDVVVAPHPRQLDLLIVKRIVDFDQSGWLHLHGDNTSAQFAHDSRTFGPVPPESIIARVVAVTGKPA